MELLSRCSRVPEVCLECPASWPLDSATRSVGCVLQATSPPQAFKEHAAADVAHVAHRVAELTNHFRYGTNQRAEVDRRGRFDLNERADMVLPCCSASLSKMRK